MPIALETIKVSPIILYFKHYQIVTLTTVGLNHICFMSSRKLIDTSNANAAQHLYMQMHDKNFGDQSIYRF